MVEQDGTVIMIVVQVYNILSTLISKALAYASKLKLCLSDMKYLPAINKGILV
jgi:hypothetical protein